MKVLWRLLRFLPPSFLSAIKRHTKSKWRLWIREKFGASAASIPDSIRAVSDGRRFHIGPDRMYWAIHMGLDYEPEATSIVRRLVLPGNTVLDIGANFGWYATLFGKCVGDAGKVIAFEPVPVTFDLLVENIRLNNLQTRVLPTRSAVGESIGEVTVYVFDRRSLLCSSLSPLNEPHYRTENAPIVDLDTYLCEQQIERVDFLKCDVEGSELAVLKGCRKLLKRDEAPIIMVELNDETSGAFEFTKADIWHLLEEHGYDHFYALGEKQDVRRLYDVIELQSIGLLLCAKGDRVGAQLAVPLGPPRGNR